MPSTLSVPVLADDADTLTAALAYAAAGWYVVPIRRGSKHPGSVVGKRWQEISSCDPDQISAWFAGTDHGIALHVGRSGAIAFDVDTPGAVPEVLADAIKTETVPFQSTRTGDPRRGHAVFLAPKGRILGNGTGGLGFGWGEVRGRNGVIVVAPSQHQKAAQGGRYRWVQTGPVPVLPAALDALLADGNKAEDAATDAEVAAFLAEHSGAHHAHLLDAVVRRYREWLEQGKARHAAAVDATVWALKEAAVGLYPATQAVEQIKVAFLESVASTRCGSGRPAGDPDAADEYAGIVAWAVAQARGADPQQTRHDLRDRLGITLPDDHGVGRTTAHRATDLVAQLRSWQHLPDDAHVLVALAAAVTAHEHDSEPAWVLLVGAPASGKTETVRLLDDDAAGHLDEVTVAGLLSWTKGKTPQPTGILTRVTRGLVTFGDLSTLLATSDNGGRDQVFALLRRVYDGEVHRDVGAPSGAGVKGPLSWKGRLTVVGAVTGAIDSYSVHAAQLGSRWLYVRLPDRGAADKRKASKLARRGGLTAQRRDAAKLAGEVIASARSRLGDVELSDQVSESIEDVALVCCWGRAGVPRHGYGRREIDGPATIEEPMRLIRQLGTLARGLLALGCSDEQVSMLLRRVALDSIPATRRAVLAELSAQLSPITTIGVARATRLDRGVARRCLEDLEIIGVVRGDRTGPAPEGEDPDRRRCEWSLADDDDGTLVAAVFNGEATS